MFFIFIVLLQAVFAQQIEKCSFKNPIANITYDDKVALPIKGGLDFKVSGNNSGIYFCLEVPNGYEVALSFGDDFKSSDFESKESPKIDSIIFSATGNSDIKDG